MGLNIESRMKLRVILNATHEGEIQTVTQEAIANALKEAIIEAIVEDDEALEVNVTCYIAEFSYQDNVESLRERVKARLDMLDMDTLMELERTIKE